MPHTNSTTHYSLPQFLSTDKPAWLTDVNPAYAAIDTAIYNAQTAADTAQNDATQALNDAASASGTASAADTKATGSVASMADAFDTTSTYDVNDIVIYNNLLYRCSVAVTVPGPWTGSANWTRTTIEALIDAANSSIATNTTAINTINSKLGSIFKIGAFSHTYSIPGNGTQHFSSSFINTPAGYSIVGFVGVSTSQGSVCLVSIKPSDTGEWAFELKNTAAGTIDNLNFFIRVLFARNDVITTI